MNGFLKVSTFYWTSLNALDHTMLEKWVENLWNEDTQQKKGTIIGQVTKINRELVYLD